MKKNPDYEGNSDEEILEKIQMEKNSDEENSDGENSANSVYVFVLNLRRTPCAPCTPY